LLGVIIAIAAVVDATRHRIPNHLNLAGIAVAFVLAALTGGFAGVGEAMAGAVVGGAMFLPFYLLHGLGAGDVKLMAVVGAFVGPSAALLAAGWALVAGALMALAFVGFRIAQASPWAASAPSVARPSGGASAPGLRSLRRSRFPYAAAIAAGVMASLWQTGALRMLFEVPGIS
jgi:prepilin peptidase CpaA